jgi:hypothetical protein
MNNNIPPQPIRPEWKWHHIFFWTKASKDYRTDRKRYDDWYETYVMTEKDRIKKRTLGWINVLSVLLITIITTLWTLLPAYVSLPNWLSWMQMGMESFGPKNWGNEIVLTLVPATSGSLLHKLPNWVTHKKVSVILHVIIKFIPVIILLITWYLPTQLKAYRAESKKEKEIKYNETVGLSEPATTRKEV